jgi:hypothetical protein
MSGGITQLVAIGAQDAHIVGNPEVSFFRSTYKRHTNFSHVVFRQVIQGIPDNGVVSTVRFERKGDMLGYVYLTKKSGASPSAQAFTGDEINYIELLIGGQVVDKQTSDFSMKIADPLLVTSQNKAVMDPTADKFYPLHFWFCESWSSALPLVAMQYHDVEIRITWKTPGAGNIYECWADYVFLDAPERATFASKAQEILMYQVQMQAPSGTGTQQLIFNQPVKFLASTGDIVTSPTTALIKLQLNGTDIGDEKLYEPHSTKVPFYYHCPNAATNFDGFLQPFCLDTSKIQPSGSLNFSRLDSARYVSTNATFAFTDYIYAVNYNVLKIENGMGGLLYAN